MKEERGKMKDSVRLRLSSSFFPLSSLVERETGFEPATSTLEGWHSAIELLPHGM